MKNLIKILLLISLVPILTIAQYNPNGSGGGGGLPVLYKTPFTTLNLGVTGNTPLTLVSSAPAGLERIVFSSSQTGNGSGGTCTTNAVINYQLQWTDSGSNISISGVTNIGLYGSSGAGQATSQTVLNTATNASTVSSITKIISPKVGTSVSINFNVGTASNCTTPPTLSIIPYVEGPIN